VDIGSIGDWGEGHCWAGSRKDLSFALRKEHIDLHLKHFNLSQLVISDDYQLRVKLSRADDRIVLPLAMYGGLARQSKQTSDLRQKDGR